MSPTQLTLAQLRKDGYTARVVEQTIHAAGRVFKRDCFGFDVLAVRPDEPGAIGIQACASASHAARRTKILGNPEAKEWVRALNRLEVWSFGKRGPRGKRKVWTLRRDEVKFSDFPQENYAATGAA